MESNGFTDGLKCVQLPCVFNPYTDRCPVDDLPDAPRRRSSTLADILNAAIATDIHSVWIGRDLGYRGGRRTGLALTDDAHIADHGMRWNLEGLETATISGEVKERTASVVWSVLDQIRESVFLWNVFPFHPHSEGEPFSNRAHNARERKIGEEILDSLVTMLKPRYLVPIGNDAAATAYRLRDRRGVTRVRHPSYGGQKEFKLQMAKFYRLGAV